MKSSVKILLIVLLFLSACKAKRAASDTHSSAEKIELVNTENVVEGFAIGSIDNINKQDLLFHINKMNIKDEKLNVQVQYGGGCVKPHVFELVTNGVINKDGTMEFFLLHKTHNDMCKALLIEDLSFDLAQLYGLKSNVLTHISLNKMPKIELK